MKLRNYILLCLVVAFLFSCNKKKDNNGENVQQKTENNINNILNKEIVIKHGFAGESLKLVFEENNYYIYRDILGSGLPSIGIIKYNVIFNSEYKITFSEIITISENIRDRYNSHEIFEIYFRDKIEIYLNGEKIVILDTNDLR